MKYLLAFLLIGCGRYPELSQPGDGWDNHLTPYVYEFIEDIEFYNVPVGRLGTVKVIHEDTRTLHRLSEEKSWVGVCLTSKYDDRRVRSEIYILEGLSEDELRHTLYHELTHCVYDAPHWGVKGDIQFPSISDKLSWQERKDRHFETLIDYIAHGRDAINLIP